MSSTASTALRARQVVELARIEARLESLGQLGVLVTAMRSMAAVRAREAQEALIGTQAFCATVDRAIASLSQLPGRKTPDETGAPVLLVITSENGFVGGFNTRIMEHVQEIRMPEERLVLIGRRGQILAGEMHMQPEIALPMTSRVSGVTQLARRATNRLMGATHARVVFAQHEKSGTYAVVHRPVLPLAADPPQNAAAAPPLHHLPTPELLDRLAGEYLFAEIAHALMESLACENNVRLLTMDAATRNIDSRFDKLRREERQALQEQTTSDMLDVIVGSEAVEGK
ncbi:FoF1 ATP synthase subunit gamma [Phaeobacter sp. CAU 1743]|uniref:F0F1 ATP synthase subunit gamma n=1 Tax=Phaeobacter sp. CAU 1743 TaxID=3140367 RepID=UPI0023B6DC17